MSTSLIVLALVLAVVLLPALVIEGMGYLIQKFMFGVPFKELYAYNKAQDALERDMKRKTAGLEED